MQKHNAQTIWYREVMINAENLCYAQNACTNAQMHKCHTQNRDTFKRRISNSGMNNINCSLHDVKDHVVI